MHSRLANGPTHLGIFTDALEPFRHICIVSSKSFLSPTSPDSQAARAPCQQRPSLSDLPNLRTPLPVPTSVASFTHDATSAAMAMNAVYQAFLVFLTQICAAVAQSNQQQVQA